MWPSIAVFLPESYNYSIWTAQYWFAVLVDVYRIARGKRSDVTIFIDFNDTAFFLIYIVFIAVILWGLHGVHILSSPLDETPSYK